MLKLILGIIALITAFFAAMIGISTTVELGGAFALAVICLVGHILCAIL